MRWTTKMLLFLMPFLMLGTARAQTTLPPETRNAALRYWLAFAEMQDAPADQATQDLLEKTAAGAAAWDESKLGPIMDKNEAAIERMQRATQLPECDWGLEVRWGSSIAYAPRARVLARLNTLYGVRRAAKGDWSGAVDAWLDGIRFSQHVARGGTLIFALVAESALLPNLRALTTAVESGNLGEIERGKIETALRALPDSGFDWAGAMRTEEALLYSFLDELGRSPKPAEFYAAAMGEPAPQNFSLPSAADRAAYHKLMASEQEALRLQVPAAQSAAGREDLIRLKILLDQLYGSGTHWFFQRATPSLIKINEARTTIDAASQGLLKAIASKRAGY